MRKILLLGCGNSRQRKIHPPGQPDWDGQLVTIDMNPACGADVVWDLENRPLPFPDEEFSEIHAYDCLEHWGRQGDWRGWFDEMGEYHRLLKPGGQFAAIVPYGAEAMADPGHTRFFDLNHFYFLEQGWYDQQLSAGRPVTDYRWYWKKNFKVVTGQMVGMPAHHIGVRLERA